MPTRSVSLVLGVFVLQRICLAVRDQHGGTAGGAFNVSRVAKNTSAHREAGMHELATYGLKDAASSLKAENATEREVMILLFAAGMTKMVGAGLFGSIAGNAAQVAGIAATHHVAAGTGLFMAHSIQTAVTWIGAVESAYEIYEKSKGLIAMVTAVRHPVRSALENLGFAQRRMQLEDGLVIDMYVKEEGTIGPHINALKENIIHILQALQERPVLTFWVAIKRSAPDPTYLPVNFQHKGGNPNNFYWEETKFSNGFAGLVNKLYTDHGNAQNLEYRQS